jgi:hypothetical protein
MSGNPLQCRLNAERCLRLAERAREPQACETFSTLAQMWTGLAAQLECDQALLGALTELDFSEPYDALPLALQLRPWAAQQFALSSNR